jgi:hypothetical protein
MAKLPDKMFYDTVLSWFSNEVDFSKKTSSPFLQAHDAVHPEHITSSEVRKEQLFRQSIQKPMHDILTESHLFLLNGAIVDSLYFLDRAQTDFGSNSHLPFDVLFFEFMDAVPFETMKGVEVPLKAVLFGKTVNADYSVKMYGKDILQVKPGLEDTLYSADLFFEDMNKYDGPRHLIFDINDLKQGDYDMSALSSVTGREYSDKMSPSCFINLAYLCLNIVNYINAHNVTLKKAERDTRDLDGINRKRVRKGKKPLTPIKPYHWIDLRPVEIVSGRKRETDGRVLEFREMVRGHFQRYHKTEGVVRNWIDPYVRGPDDTPWRENRYRLLETMLRRGTNY